ncbi:MAG: histidine phosphatase family protein [Firmicutes bacterium]|nr:histidine phosphatase family protein [Bacillota bacterium]
MKLLVIRHGESEADLLKVHEGRADFALTEAGQRQAAAMAKWVAQHYPVDKIYASTLIRAQQTAKALAATTNAPLIDEPGLREHDNGLLAGLPFEEAAAKYPPIPNRPPHLAPYEMESEIDFRCRVEKALSKIIHENTLESTIALVCHGGTIKMLYQAFLGLPIASDVVFATGDTGIHLWEYEPGKRRILFANRTAHLD